MSETLSNIRAPDQAAPETNADQAQKPKISKEKYDKQRDQFLITFNNPLTHGYNHDQIKEIIHRKFKHLQFYCMADEISTTGTPHTHLYILLTSKKRWSAVQNAFKHAHIEEEVRGSPQQVVHYIKKDADNLTDEKRETSVPGTYEEWGSIPEVLPNASRNEILLQIQDLIDQDYRPEEIMEKSILFRQYETIIRKSFFARRYAETPPLREVRCYWHLGASGSGKSYTYVKLCEQHASDDVFFASDYSNKCTALFDGYQAESYVLLDELKTGCMPYELMLQLLQGYRTQLHCRYSNVYALYKEVHITSIFTPHEIYNEMVTVSNRTTDTLYQLLRRITAIIYHYKDEHGNYCTLEIPTSEFTTYADLQKKIQQENDTGDFHSLTEPSPFEDTSADSDMLLFEN